LGGGGEEGGSKGLRAEPERKIVFVLLWEGGFCGYGRRGGKGKKKGSHGKTSNTNNGERTGAPLKDSRVKKHIRGNRKNTTQTKTQKE